MEYIDIPSVRKNATGRKRLPGIKLASTQAVGSKIFTPLLIDSNMENDKRATMLAMLESRKESFDEAIKDAKEKDISPDESEHAPQPLSLDVKVEKNLTLSWGGPSDGFKFYYNEEGDELDAVYWYADWGTYEEINLSGKEKMLVKELYGGMLER